MEQPAASGGHIGAEQPAADGREKRRWPEEEENNRLKLFLTLSHTALHMFVVVFLRFETIFVRFSGDLSSRLQVSLPSLFILSSIKTLVYTIFSLNFLGSLLLYVIRRSPQRRVDLGK
jgi:hypothetical protein